MLVELSIKNLAVIESVRLHCSRGFHVLTGETGAGKSIIIDALSLIVGGRGSAELVRHGCDKAEIECTFDIQRDHPIWKSLELFGIDASHEEYLVIRREMTAQGKSTGRINGQLVNLTMLREIGEWLVNIHGQHEHQSLLKVDQHLQWLDLYDGKNILTVKEKYRASYKKYRGLIKELKELQETSKQSLQMMDLYHFQIEEIEAAQLKVGEDECLLEEKQKLANAEKMFQSTSEAYELIYENQNGLGAVSKAMSRIEAVASYDPSRLQPLLEQIQTSYYQLEDAAHQLRDYRDLIEFNPERLDEIETRLNLLYTLRRKYGENVEEILQYLKKIKLEVEAVENKDTRIKQLENDIDQEQKYLTITAQQLSTQRKKAAASLAKQIEVELRDLHMERTRFEVNMEVNGQFTEEGSDLIEFMISANPGEPLKSLSKIASGGELSRIMLALKAIFSSVDRIPVLVFDEVDTGVSGRAAQAIAEKMSKLSNECQVFSITHLPQVACMADEHYAIRKQVNNERTFTCVNQLIEEDQIEELARMLGGVEVTETTEHHAKEMLDMAKKKKQQWNHLQ
jgi:DNA repair protein RecN (Recombination protein N)